MKAFITSQLSYCPLIWMLHSKTLNNGIKNIHERALKLTYKGNKFSFKQLLEKDHSVTVHYKNLQVLDTEIFKVKNNLAPDIMKDVSELKEPPYNLRSESNHFTRRNVKSTYYGLLSVKHLAPQIWELVPQSIRKCKTLNEFKTKINSWYPDHCLCMLCKTCMAQLGFIWSAYIYLFMAESGYMLVTIVYLQDDVIMMSSLVLLSQLLFFACTYLIYILIYLFTYVLDLTYYYCYYHYYFWRWL